MKVRDIVSYSQVIYNGENIYYVILVNMYKNLI